MKWGVFMIAGLDASGALQSLYPSYNKKKVSKVKRVSHGGPSASELSNTKITDDTDTLEDTITATMQASLAEKTEGVDILEYNDSNPYAAAKKTLDGSLLIGMNIDEKA